MSNTMNTQMIIKGNEKDLVDFLFDEVEPSSGYVKGSKKWVISLDTIKALEDGFTFFSRLPFIDASFLSTLASRYNMSIQAQGFEPVNLLEAFVEIDDSGEIIKDTCKQIEHDEYVERFGA